MALVHADRNDLVNGEKSNHAEWKYRIAVLIKEKVMGPSGRVEKLDSDKTMDTLSIILGKQEKYADKDVAMWPWPGGPVS